MNNHEKYKLAFSVLQPEISAEQIKRSAVENRSHVRVRRLWAPVLAAAVMISLVVSVSAVGVSRGWLTSILSNAEEHPELTDRVLTPEETGVLDGMRYSLDQILSEGPVVFFQFSVKSEDGQPVPENLYLNGLFDYEIILEDGTVKYPFELGLRSVGGAFLRIDDGTNPGFAQFAQVELFKGLENLDPTETYHLKMGYSILPEVIDPGEALTGVPTGSPVTPVLDVTIPLDFDDAYLEAKLENDTAVRLGTVSLEIRGYDFFGLDENHPAELVEKDSFGVILSDGSRVPARWIHNQWDSSVADLDYWSAGVLCQVIDPAEVAAIFYGDQIFPVLN